MSVTITITDVPERFADIVRSVLAAEAARDAVAFRRLAPRIMGNDQRTASHLARAEVMDAVAMQIRGSASGV